MTSTPASTPENEKPKPRKRPLWAGLFLLLAIGASGVWWLFQPVSNVRRPVPVTINEGAGVGSIGESLYRAGVIRSPFAFSWTARRQGAKLKAGRYTLSGHESLAQIVQRLEAGPEQPPDDRLRVTIPEGFTLRQIADRLDEKGVTEGKAFLALATDREAIGQLRADFPLPKETLEGYLFPDTYYFRGKSSPEQVIETMMTNFTRRFVRPYQQELEASGRSLHDLVTEASLIEREARIPEDRARIAGVLDNRLKKGMRLQIDATVLYALGQHKARVLYKDLEIDSPYNTYRHKGLPPGPIANPGLASLEAALRPEENAYLYYVARANGAHIFTKTLAEHEAAIRRVRAERSREERNTESPRPRGGEPTEERPGG